MKIPTTKFHIAPGYNFLRVRQFVSEVDDFDMKLVNVSVGAPHLLELTSLEKGGGSATQYAGR